MYDFKVNSAWEHYYAGRYDLSIDLLKEVLGENPENASLHGLLAANLLEKYRIHAAKYELSIALKSDPQDPFLYWVAAMIDLRSNKIKGCIENCNECLRLDPEYYNALLLKSDALQLLERNKEALECIEEAAKQNPNGVGIFVAFGEYHLHCGENGKAYMYARRALSVEAASEAANLLMGQILLRKGDVNEAEYHAKFVIMNNPESEEALELLANVKSRKNVFLGLWWRVNVKVSSIGNTRASLVLVLAFVFFNFLSQLLADFSMPVASEVVSYLWLLLVAYSWVAIPVYNRMLAKEMRKFSFNSNF